MTKEAIEAIVKAVTDKIGEGNYTCVGLSETRFLQYIEEDVRAALTALHLPESMDKLTATDIFNEAKIVISRTDWSDPDIMEAYENGFNAGAFWVRDLPSTPLSPAQNWVSVEDRLPEGNKDVIVWRQYWDIPIQAWFNTVTKKWHGSRDVRDEMKECYAENSELQQSPTHWQPLPLPPTSDNR